MQSELGLSGIRTAVLWMQAPPDQAGGVITTADALNHIRFCTSGPRHKRVADGSSRSLSHGVTSAEQTPLESVSFDSVRLDVHKLG